MSDMKSMILIAVAAVMLLASVGSVSAVNLVSNGGFEKPLVTSVDKWDIFADGSTDLVWDVQWAFPPPVSPTGRPDLANAEFQLSGIVLAGEPITAFEGSQYAELDTDWNGHVGTLDNEPANVVMSQDIATAAGKHYTISWEQRRRGDDGHNPSTLAFSWNGDGPLVTNGTTGGWTKYSTERIASGASTTISFTGTSTPDAAGDSYGALIDDIIVEQVPDEVPIPEFPTVALPAALIVGLLGAVLFIQKSKEE